MVRPTYIDSTNGLKKGAWSEEEDNKLRAYIQRFGHWNWRLLPKYAGLARCGKSCRLRWVNYLKPGTKHGQFSKHEEDLVVQLHDQLGNKWSAIAAKLPGRTDNEIKNFWHTNIKKRNRRNPKKNIETEKVSIKDDDQMVMNGQPSDQITTPFDEIESTSMDSIKEFNIVNSGPMITSNDGQACDRSSSDSHIIAHEQSSLDDMMSLWTQPYAFLDHDTAAYSQNTHNFPDFFQSQQLYFTELSSFDSSFPSPDILDHWKSSDDGNIGSSQPFVLNTCQENTNYNFSSQDHEEILQGENYDYCFQYNDDHGLDLFYVPQEY